MTKRYLIDYAGRGEYEHPSGDFVHYSDHESELATLRARVEELERADEQRARDISRLTIERDDARDHLSEATRLAVEALTRVADIAKRNLGHQTEKLYDIEPVARAALDRLNAMKGESE